MPYSNHKRPIAGEKDKPSDSAPLTYDHMSNEELKRYCLQRIETMNRLFNRVNEELPVGPAGALRGQLKRHITETNDFLYHIFNLL